MSVRVTGPVVLPGGMYATLAGGLGFLQFWRARDHHARRPLISSHEQRAAVMIARLRRNPYAFRGIKGA